MVTMSQYVEALKVEREMVATRYPDDAVRLAEIDAEIGKFAPVLAERQKRDTEDRARRRSAPTA